jgi:hypothetical protein
MTWTSTDDTCNAPALVPAGHSREALGELSADCALAAGHAGAHSNGLAVWAADEALADTCDAAIPAGLARFLSGDAAGGCLRDAGHEAWADHHNGAASWPVQASELPRSYDVALFAAVEAS